MVLCSDTLYSEILFLYYLIKFQSVSATYILTLYLRGNYKSFYYIPSGDESTEFDASELDLLLMWPDSDIEIRLRFTVFFLYKDF